MSHILNNPPLTVTSSRKEDIIVIDLEKKSSSAGGHRYDNYSELAEYDLGVVKDRLSMEFRTVRLDMIYQILYIYKNHYTPAHRTLTQALDAVLAKREEQRVSRKKPIRFELKFPKEEKMRSQRFNLMKTIRVFSETKMTVKDPRLLAEIEFVAQRLKLDKEERDRKVAWALLESEYEEQGQLIECGCCCVEHPFENLVQCFEAHLFCKQCLLSYAKEAIFGSGKLCLQCLSADCDSIFPKSQLMQALPHDLMQKYDERMEEENLNKAAIPDLIRCPSCNVAVVLDWDVQVLVCPNTSCKKITCRHCKQDWDDHKGKSCDEMEKKDETKLRTVYEEKMTAARIRKCCSCQAEFFKEEGCNRMTCRCGATMCYLCRVPNISYEHFCNHPRDPGHNCTSCQRCSLWTNLEEDEKRAVAEIQREAQEKRKERGFLGDRLIGAPEDKQPPAKKIKQ